jgi:CubicO group peptidase (beta-lactamase class C family)
MGSICPCGGISASASDMANIMLAHLNGGRLAGASNLSENTAQQMQKPLFTHDPRVNSIANGSIELSRNDQRIIVHGGDTIFFHSMKVLFPKHNLGVFVSYNSDGGGALTHDSFPGAFIDHYFPGSNEIFRVLKPSGVDIVATAAWDPEKGLSMYNIFTETMFDGDFPEFHSIKKKLYDNLGCTQ